MSYIRRQRSGSQEYGDKKVGESQTDYDAKLFEEETE
jgi:hypothetical protein